MENALNSLINAYKSYKNITTPKNPIDYLKRFLSHKPTHQLSTTSLIAINSTAHQIYTTMSNSELNTNFLKFINLIYETKINFKPLLLGCEQTKKARNRNAAVEPVFLEWAGIYKRIRFFKSNDLYFNFYLEHAMELIAKYERAVINSSYDPLELYVNAFPLMRELSCIDLYRNVGDVCIEAIHSVTNNDWRYKLRNRIINDLKLYLVGKQVNLVITNDQIEIIRNRIVLSRRYLKSSELNKNLEISQKMAERLEIKSLEILLHVTEHVVEPINRKLEKSLNFMKNTFFCGRSDFLQHFVDKLKEPNSSLVYALNYSVDKCFYDYLNLDFVAIDKNDTSLFFLPTFPENLILKKETVLLFSNVFRLLWKIKKIENLLKNVKKLGVQRIKTSWYLDFVVRLQNYIHLYVLENNVNFQVPRNLEFEKVFYVKNAEICPFTTFKSQIAVAVKNIHSILFENGKKQFYFSVLNEMEIMCKFCIKTGVLNDENVNIAMKQFLGIGFLGQFGIYCQWLNGLL